jgi:hypothetical protein
MLWLIWKPGVSGRTLAGGLRALWRCNAGGRLFSGHPAFQGANYHKIAIFLQSLIAAGAVRACPGVCSGYLPLYPGVGGDFAMVHDPDSVAESGHKAVCAAAPVVAGLMLNI